MTVRLVLGPWSALSESAPLAAVAEDGRVVAAFEVDGQPRAYAGLCLHRGGWLADGWVHDGTVTCAAHFWRYDLRSGELVGRPGERLAAYPVEEVDGQIVASLPDMPSRPSSIRDRLLAAARSRDQA